MQKVKVFTVVVLCLGLVFGLMSCRTPAGRTAGEVVDDGTISTTVKARLFDDPLMSGFAISVDTFQGEVTLTGAVDSVKAKNRAGDLAAGVYGVKRVNNLIKIK